MPEQVARCVICGKTIQNSSTVYRIMKGILNQNLFAKSEEFGVAHELCFIRALPTPQAAMQELRKLSGK